MNQALTHRFNPKNGWWGADPIDYFGKVCLGARDSVAESGLNRPTHQRPATLTRAWRCDRNGNPRLTGNPARRPYSRDRRKRATLNDVAAIGPRNGRSTERMESLKAHAGPARDGRRGTVGSLGLPYCLFGAPVNQERARMREESSHA